MIKYLAIALVAGMLLIQPPHGDRLICHGKYVRSESGMTLDTDVFLRQHSTTQSTRHQSRTPRRPRHTSNLDYVSHNRKDPL